MKFSDIEDLTYMGSTVTVDGVDREIITALASDLYAVQYHTGRPMLEELQEQPLTQEVPDSKYQYALDEWVDAEVIPVPDIPPTSEEIAIQEALAYLASTDFYFTIDKYTTLSETRIEELRLLRAEARLAVQ